MRNPKVNYSKSQSAKSIPGQAASCEVTFKEAGSTKNMADFQNKDKKVASENEERDQRAARRNLAKVKEDILAMSKEDDIAKSKEDISAKSAKRARLDLFDSLGPSATVRDILFASFTKPATSSENMEVEESPSDTGLFKHTKDPSRNATDLFNHTRDLSSDATDLHGGSVEV